MNVFLEKEKKISRKIRERIQLPLVEMELMILVLMHSRVGLWVLREDLGLLEIMVFCGLAQM